MNRVVLKSTLLGYFITKVLSTISHFMTIWPTVIWDQTKENERMISKNCCGYIRPHSDIFTLFHVSLKLKIKVFKDLE
jgi:hypothetical protein